MRLAESWRGKLSRREKLKGVRRLACVVYAAGLGWRRRQREARQQRPRGAHLRQSGTARPTGVLPCVEPLDLRLPSRRRCSTSPSAFSSGDFCLILFICDASGREPRCGHRDAARPAHKQATQSQQIQRHGARPAQPRQRSHLRGRAPHATR